ncbi:MAG: peptidylprolyl isomerase [Flavobacteriales bacterium]|nr:peptidylprolyl isomerase [Flavobacteriales bacterium]
MNKTALLITISLLWSVAAFAQPQGEIIDRIIGVVGNEIVLQSDLENDLLQQRLQGVDPDGDSRCVSIEGLLFSRLLLHQSRLDSLVVTEQQIQSEIEKRLAYYMQLFGSVEAFEAEYGKSVAQWRDEFREPIEEQLLIQQMQYQLQSRVTATPKQVKEYFDNMPTDSIPLISEQVEYSMIIIEPAPTPQEVAAKRNQADSVRALVAEGKMRFNLAASRFSDDPGSKYKGGCYENISKGAFVPAFEEMVYSTELEQLSPVFETEFGFHFLKPTDKRGQVFSCCHVLFSPTVSDDALVYTEGKIDSIATAIRADSLTFEQAAIRFSTNEDTRNQGGRVANFRVGGMKHSVDELDRNVFLVLDKLEVGEVSEPILIQSPGGNPQYAIYKLDSRLAAHQANLKDDYLLFKQQVEADMQETAVDKWIEKRLRSTFVKLNPDYKDCEFRFMWIKGDS